MAVLIYVNTSKQVGDAEQMFANADAAQKMIPGRLFDPEAYLVSPFVGVVSGFCTPPDLGITVSFMFVGGMFGSTSTRFSGLSALQSIP